MMMMTSDHPNSQKEKIEKFSESFLVHLRAQPFSMEKEAK